MYTVEVRHNTKAYRNGELECELVLEESKNFKTRKAAKCYIESQLKRKHNIQRYYHKGDEPSNCYYFTGVSWIHENTGEECNEYYQYTLKKAKVY